MLAKLMYGCLSMPVCPNVTWPRSPVPPTTAVTLVAEMLELLVEVGPEPARPDLRDGWRGILDLGEVWTVADGILWPGGSGRLPVGEPLTYGCELRVLSDGIPFQGRLLLLAIESPRTVMKPGAQFTLCDGRILRATGRLL